MATQDEIISAIRAADKAGDSESVRKLGSYLKTMSQAAPTEAAPDPTEGMSTTDKFLAGVGKGFSDVGRGVGQLVGLTSQEDINEAKRLDAPLMNTTAGTVGNVTGTVAAALPTVFIPGAQTIGGAAALGGVMGLTQPVATGESRLSNVGMGIAGGAGGVAAGRMLAAGVKGAKALVEPFTGKGRQAIAGRTLDRFGIQSGDLANVTGNKTVTGAVPMMAEQIARPEGAAGAARLQDSVRTLDPEIANRFVAREAENNAARVGTLRDLSGEGGARDFAEAMRNGTAKEQYGKAFATKMDMSTMSAAERGEVTKLMQTPAIKDALKEAQTIAKNQGMNLNKPDGSVEGLHLMKLAMDDAIEAASKGGSAVAVNKAMSIKTARDRLVKFIERVAPDYGDARMTYAEMSKPLNQMDVAEALFRKGTSATSDLGGTPRLMPDKFVSLLKNEEATVKGATGRDLGKLSQVLDPDQYAKVMAVGQELDKGAAVARAANGPGSATAQRLASQNVLRQLLGPTGLPQSWAESTLLNTAMRPVQFAYNGVAEPKIQAVLADLLLDPSKAQAALQAAKVAPKTLPKAVREALPYLEQAMKASIPAAALAGQR
jgi:hypothetical protein